MFYKRIGKYLVILLIFSFTISEHVVIAADWFLHYGLSVTETWDSNINRTSTNEMSDFITHLTPTLSLRRNTENTKLSLNYEAPLSYYARHHNYDFPGQNFSLNWTHHLTEKFNYFINESYFLSNSAQETTDNVTSIRKTRKSYYTITSTIGSAYNFTDRDKLSVRYSDSRQQNRDPSVEDSISYGPTIGVSYWPKEHIGFNFGYSFNRREYERTPPNYTSNYSSGVTWIVTPHTSSSFTYNVARFHSEALKTEDYTTQSANVGVNHQIGPHLSSSLSLGYYYRNPTRSRSNSGITYSLSLKKALEYGGISITGKGGYKEEYVGPERKGFTRTRGISASFHYKLGEFTNMSFAVGYLYEKPASEDKIYETWNTSFSLHRTFLKWLTGFSSISYIKRNVTDNTESFQDWTITIGLSAHGISKL